MDRFPFYCMASSVSGQGEPNPALRLATRACKIDRYRLLHLPRFVPGIEFHRTPKAPKLESFSLENIFRVSKTIFCDFSVGMKLENVETGSVNESENEENNMLMSLIKEYILQQKPANPKVKTH